MSKSSGQTEKTFTLADLTKATAQLSLHRFKDTAGSFSGETAQKMMRLELAIELERFLLWGTRDPNPMDELVSEAQRLGFYDPPKAS